MLRHRHEQQEKSEGNPKDGPSETDLELDDMDMGGQLAKNSILDNVVQHGIELEAEDAGDEVEAVDTLRALLLCSVDDLGPLGIAGEGDEKVRLAMLPGHRHGVLVELIVVALAADEAGGEDDSAAYLLCRERLANWLVMDDGMDCLQHEDGTCSR